MYRRCWNFGINSRQAVSDSDGLVGQLPMGVGRMVLCERRGRVNSSNEQALNYASSHQFFWLVSAKLSGRGVGNKKEIQSKVFLL